MATFGDIAEITMIPCKRLTARRIGKRVDGDSRLEGGPVAWAFQNTAELSSVCSGNEGRRRTRRRTNLSGVPGSGVLEIIYPLVACIYGR